LGRKAASGRAAAVIDLVDGSDFAAFTNDDASRRVWIADHSRGVDAFTADTKDDGTTELVISDSAEPAGGVTQSRQADGHVAFRDTEGRIGLLDEFCPHRRVSLWLGRNEECGLRCVYHGWKYDVDGNCVDQMNEPGENSFADKVHIKHYPTLELGGIVWTFMGPAEKMPPPPSFAFTRVPASHRHVSKVIEECSWLQALEGGID